MTRLFRSSAALAGFAALSLLAACGPKTALPAGYATCKAPSVICLDGTASGQCIDIAVDPNNCGSCGNVCGAPSMGGTASCVAGECVQGCGSGLTVCGLTGGDGGITSSGDAGASGAICIDTSVDPNHCGSCDVRCLDTQVCTASACVPAGPSTQGTTACSLGPDGGPVYVQLQTDRANCGACGNACGAAEICESGACNPCDIAQCNNVCVDTRSDLNNCGSCGVVAMGSCDNGVSRPLPVITVLPSTSSGFLPVGTPTVSVSVQSGIRIASVTVVATLTNATTTTTSNVYPLAIGGDANLSPTTWSFNWANLSSGTTGMPALAAANTPEQVTLAFTAYDEQYGVGRTDAASHMSTLTWMGIVVTPAPITLATPSASSTVTGSAPAALATGSWVPLNAAPITFTESPQSAPSATSYIVGVEFHSVSASGTALVLGGANPVIPFGSGAATVTVNPADLGLGLRSIVPCQVDVFGNRLCSASSFQLTIGDITPYAGSNVAPILAHGTDGVDSIWLLGATGGSDAGTVCTGAAANYMAQPYDQTATSPSAIGKAIDPADTYCPESFFETYESTGVYGVNSTGASIARFDGAAAVNAAFVAAPPNDKIARLEGNSITGQALAFDDISGNGWFAKAAPGTAAPNNPQEAGGADGGSFYAVPPVGAGANALPVAFAASTAGALWSWVAVPTGVAVAGQQTQYQLDIFHPAIANNSTQIKGYLATGGGSPATPLSLTVFPGGEYVWEEVDASGAMAMGAGRFDGTNQPIDLAGATASGVVLTANAFAIGVQRTLASTSFFVPAPGILVGLVPSRVGLGANAAASAGYEAIEIDLTSSPAKIYHPNSPISVSGTVPSGEVLVSGVSDRYGAHTTFTVSDDLKKVLYVTKASVGSAAVPVKDTYSINLLDLATGTASVIFSSQFINNDDVTNNAGPGALTVYPHFLHGVKSYSGLPAAATQPIAIWPEELPVGGGAAAGSIYERLYYANYSSGTVTPVQLDRLAFASYNGSPSAIQPGIAVPPISQLIAESVTANSIYFLSNDQGGELSLYSRAFDGSSASTLVSKGVTAWNLREDSGRQVVLRADGTLLAGQLSGAGALAAIYQSDSGGDGFNVSLAPVAGLTADGARAWALVHLDQTYDISGEGSVPLLDATLVTIDLTTGARTDWGSADGYLIGVAGAPFALVGTGAASALYGCDHPVSSTELLRLYSATAAAPTTHATAFGPLNLIQPTFPPAYSADAQEALFAPFGISAYDVTALPANAAAFSSAIAFILDGPSALGRPDFPSYGPNHLPAWALAINPNGTVYKAFGGTFQAPILIDRGAAATPAPVHNRITPDFSQFLAHFVDGNGQSYVMKLPGLGAAPIVPAPR